MTTKNTKRPLTIEHQLNHFFYHQLTTNDNNGSRNTVVLSVYKVRYTPKRETVDILF